MNWGKKILIVYSVFVAGILWMVFKSSNEKIDLVTADYYAKELKYQDEINDAKRAGRLSVPVTCKVEQNNLLIKFPGEFNGKNISADVWIYYPADEGKDIKKVFTVKDASVNIPIPGTNHGLHEIKINWKAEGIGYYSEQKIFL